MRVLTSGRIRKRFDSNDSGRDLLSEGLLFLREKTACSPNSIVEKLSDTQAFNIKSDVFCSTQRAD
jgi:hypothetical protein